MGPKKLGGSVRLRRPPSINPHLKTTHKLCTLSHMLKNLTVSVDPTIIDRARAKAAAEHTTLNNVVRRLLADFVQTGGRGHDFDVLMKELDHCRSGGPFGRDEANER